MRPCFKPMARYPGNPIQERWIFPFVAERDLLPVVFANLTRCKILSNIFDVEIFLCYLLVN